MPGNIVREHGRIREIREGIALIEGLPSVMAEELLTFGAEKKLAGMTLGFDEEIVKAVVFSDSTSVRRDDDVWPSGHGPQVPVGEPLLGRVVNPLGEALDGKGALEHILDYAPIEREADGIVDREPVSQPLLTGIQAVDTLIPIGRGQRELIIGDRKIGKTSLAIDAIISQRLTPRTQGKQVPCIYCTIGQKKTEVARIFETLRKHGAMGYTIGVAAAASDATPLRYIAPYSAMAMAEYFRDRGDDVLIVFDDLTKHAWSWRELSSLLERIPGREGFPGDVFYLHSRLLERAGRRRRELGGGSITALPIAETQEGEISGYIPTNLISITDGQIYLEPELFRAGTRPAINIGLSVSRVGGRAQPPVLRDIAKGLRLKLSHYQELARFGELETRLEKETAKMLQEGSTLRAVLQQGERRPRTIELQTLLVLGALEHTLGAYAERPLANWEREFWAFLDVKYPALGQKLWQAERMTEELKEELLRIIKGFTAR